MGAQWLSVRVLDSRPKGRGFETHRRHCVVSLSKNINPSLVLVQPRKTRPFINERLLMGRKESNQTNKYDGSNIKIYLLMRWYGPDALAVCRARRGLPDGFLLLRYICSSVLFTVESLSLLYLFLYLDLYVLGDDALIS